MFFEACDVCNSVFGSNLKIFRMEIRNASATPSKSNQLRNVNTIRLKSSNITTQPGEIDVRKSEVIAFVVNAIMNITANNFTFKSRKEVSLSKVFALINWSSVGYMLGIYFSNSGLSMMNISSRYREVSLNKSIRLDLFRFVKNWNLWVSFSVSVYFLLLMNMMNSAHLKLWYWKL